MFAPSPRALRTQGNTLWFCEQLRSYLGSRSSSQERGAISGGRLAARRNILINFSSFVVRLLSGPICSQHLARLPARFGSNDTVRPMRTLSSQQPRALSKHSLIKLPQHPLRCAPRLGTRRFKWVSLSSACRSWGPGLRPGGKGHVSPCRELGRVVAAFPVASGPDVGAAGLFFLPPPCLLPLTGNSSRGR